MDTNQLNKNEERNTKMKSVIRSNIATFSVWTDDAVRPVAFTYASVAPVVKHQRCLCIGAGDFCQGFKVSDQFGACIKEVIDCLNRQGDE